MGVMTSQITDNSTLCSRGFSCNYTFALLALFDGIHWRSPVDSPHYGPVTRKAFPCHDVIMDEVDLTHCGLMTPYGDLDLGQHWPRWWLVALQHQAITWASIDLSSGWPSKIHLRVISQEIPQVPITKIILKISCQKFHSSLPGDKELS